jgi:hypothetical protein
VSPCTLTIDTYLEKASKTTEITVIQGKKSSPQDCNADTLEYEAGDLSAARCINTTRIHSYRTREKTSLEPNTLCNVKVPYCT